MENLTQKQIEMLKIIYKKSAEDLINLLKKEWKKAGLTCDGRQPTADKLIKEINEMSPDGLQLVLSYLKIQEKRKKMKGN